MPNSPEPQLLLPETEPLDQQAHEMAVRTRNGLLYRYGEGLVQRIRPWPDPKAWESREGGPWEAVEPWIDLSAADGRYRPFTWQGLEEAELWAAVPQEVVRAVVDGSLQDQQWASLQLMARVPEALELAAEVPVLAGALAVHPLLQQEPVEEPYEAARALFRLPRGMRRWRAIADWLDLSASRAFINVLRRIVFLPHRPLAVEHLLTLREAWQDPWGRKIICHARQFDRNTFDLLCIAMEQGRLTELQPGLLRDGHFDGEQSVVPRRFSRVASSWAVLHPGKPLPRMHSALQLLVQYVDLRASIRERFKLDVRRRLPPRRRFPVPPVAGLPRKIMPLRSPKAMENEGVALLHCIGTPCRIESVRRLEGFAYKIQLPERRATAWISPTGDGSFKLGEVRGPRNKRAPRELVAQVRTWLEDALASKGVDEAWRDARSPWLAAGDVPEELAWALEQIPF